VGPNKSYAFGHFRILWNRLLFENVDLSFKALLYKTFGIHTWFISINLF
jgi:hypothetical protein